MARTQGIDLLVSKTIDSVVNGISQQPTTIRLDSQCEVQDNMLSSVVRGCEQRPPSEYVAELTTDAIPAKGYFSHMRNRDASKQHLVLVEDGEVRVWNILTGQEAVVTGGVEGYLAIASGSVASEAYSAVSVADYTFIVNKETTVAMSGSPTGARDNEFMIYWFETGGDGSNDWNHILGTAPSSPPIQLGNTPTGTKPGIMIERLSNRVYNGPNDAGTYYPRWTTTIPHQTVLLCRQTTDTGNPDDIGIPTYDFSDAVYAFIGPQTQKFSDLPPKAVDGFLTEITGSDANEENNYWITFVENKQAWVETVGPAQDDTINAATMPHVLIQTSVGGGVGGADEFSFGEQTWDNRKKGDIDSAPEPSFIGKTISDVVFHKNRFGICADENTILSEAGEFFNFWPTTVTALIDSDPIDVAGTNNRVAIIDYAIPFDSRLFTFSGHGAVQNALEGIGDKGLTAANAAMPEASAFASSPFVRPKASGKSLFFVVDHEAATEVKEYGIVDGVADADGITSHVPTYIPANIKQLALSNKRDIIALWSSDELNKLYVYVFHYDLNRDKVQSSWSRWIFDPSYIFHGIEWIGDTLYLVVERDDALHLEKINVATLAENDLDHRVFLDSLTSLLGVYTETDDKTRWTPPYEADDGVFRAVLSDDLFTDTGQSILLDIQGNGKLFADGDFSAAEAHIGREYPFVYEFSKPSIQLTGGDTAKGAEPVTQGRLNVGKMKLLIADAAGFNVTVQSTEVDADEQLTSPTIYTYEYPEKIVNMGVIGPANLRPTDTFQFDVGMEGKFAKISINGNSHLPFSLIAAEWEGRYVSRSTRI